MENLEYNILKVLYIILMVIVAVCCIPLFLCLYLAESINDYSWGKFKRWL